MEEEQHLPRPHKRIFTRWESHEIREALEKSRPTLLSLSHDVPKLHNVKNLFLVDTKGQNIEDMRVHYASYGHDDDDDDDDDEDEDE